MKYHNGQPLSHLGDLAAMGAQRYGEKVAIRLGDSHRTYAELHEESDRIASALANAGVGSGDRVAIAMENTLEFVPILYGIIKAGGVAVPLNIQLSQERLGYVLNDADVSVCFGSEQLHELAVGLHDDLGLDLTIVPGGGSAEGVTAEGVEPFETFATSDSFERFDADITDVCIQGYTSGTTGYPKGVPMTHQNVLEVLQAFTQTEEIDPETDTTLTITPMFHILGLIGTTLLTLYSGREVVLMNQVDGASLLEAIDTHEVTDFTAVPAIYLDIVEEYEATPDRYDISSLTSIGTGAAPLPEDTRRRIEGTFDSALVEGWAMTETVAAGTTGAARGRQKGAGCIGQPIPGIEMKLVDPDTRETRVPPEHLDPYSPADLTGYEPDFEDETKYTGEIAIRGPQVFEGYYEMPEENEDAFEDEGWFYTDDIARVDEDRFLWMVDRADDMMIVGGENVYPAEIEDKLFTHPDIQEAAVVPATHERKGEAPIAYVVPADDADLTEEEVREFALEHVAPYAHPRTVIFVEEFPRSGSGKVQRYKLEERAKEEVGSIESSEEI